jgi:TP901 family phage tail tape measure protein
MNAAIRIVATVVGLQSIEGLQKSIGGIETAAGKAKKAFLDVTKSATWQAAAVGAAAIGAGLVSSVKTAMDFEKAMSGVQAKVGGTAAEIDQLNKLARDLGRSTQFSASEAAAGMDFLAMAGFKTNEIISAMPGLLNLAAAGNLELGKAADIASNILGGMNLEASETGRVADVLAKAATSSNVSVEMLGETFKYVAPIAAQAGASLEEMAAAAGLLGDAGVQASEAGTGLRSVLLRLAAPPETAANALHELGVVTKDTAGNMRPFGDILKDVDKAMKDMNLGTADVLRLQTALFGKTAVTTGALLQQAAATGTLEQKTKELMESQGAAAEMAEVMNDNLAGAFKRLVSALEGFQIQLVSGTNPVLKTVVELLANFINVVTDGMEKFPIFTGIIVTLVAAFAGLVAAAPFIAAFISVIGSLISVIGSLKVAMAGLALGATVAGWAGAIIPAMTAIAAKFAALGATVAGFAGAVVPAMTAIAAKLATIFPVVTKIGTALAGLGKILLGVFTGPVGWVALVVAAGVAIYAFRDQIGEVFNAIGNIIQDAAAAFKSTFIDPIANMLQGFIQDAQQKFSDFGNAVQSAFTAAWDFVRSTFIDPVTTGMQSFFDNTVQLFQRLPDAIKAPFEAVANTIRGIINQMLNGIGNAMNSVVRAINGLISGANAALSRLGLPQIPFLNEVDIPQFAKGGVVTGPTLAMVGEGGEPEYIVPQSKAAGFAANWSAGRRGAAAIPAFAEGGVVMPSSANVSIQTGPVTQMNGAQFVTTQDLSAAVQSGVQQTLALLRNDTNTRRAVGIA